MSLRSTSSERAAAVSFAFTFSPEHHRALLTPGLLLQTNCSLRIPPMPPSFTALRTSLPWHRHPLRRLPPRPTTLRVRARQKHRSRSRFRPPWTRRQSRSTISRLSPRKRRQRHPPLSIRRAGHHILSDPQLLPAARKIKVSDSSSVRARLSPASPRAELPLSQPWWRRLPFCSDLDFISITLSLHSDLWRSQHYTVSVRLSLV